MTTTVVITDEVLQRWFSLYRDKIIQDEINYLQWCAPSPLQSSVIPRTIKNWLADIGAVYFEQECPPSLAFEDENAAAQFVITWLT